MEIFNKLFFPEPDLGRQVKKISERSMDQIGHLERGMHSENCPGLTIADRKSMTKYDPISDRYALVDSGPIARETMQQLCKNIRDLESLKIRIARDIVEALEMYSDEFEWLINGDYCAAANQSEQTKRQWRVRRFRDTRGPERNQSVRHDESTCAGLYIPAMIPWKQSGKQSLSPEYAPEEFEKMYYKMDAVENAEWQYMVKSLTGDFTSAMRKLREILNKLLVEKVKSEHDLNSLDKDQKDVLSSLERSFQYFMKRAFEGDYIRPVSIRRVHEEQLQKRLESQKLAGQKSIIKKAGKETLKNTLQTAGMKWKMPLSSAPSVYSSNHFAALTS